MNTCTYDHLGSFVSIDNETLQEIDGGVVPAIILGGWGAVKVVTLAAALFAGGYIVGKDMASR